jgi:hypothetical protein
LKLKKELFELAGYCFSLMAHVGNTDLTHYDLNYHKVILLANSITFKKFTFC